MPFPLFEIIIIQGTSFYIEDNTIFNVYLKFRNTEYFEQTNELVAEMREMTAACQMIGP